MQRSSEYWLSMDLSSQSGSLAIHRLGPEGMILLQERALPEGGKHSESLLPNLMEILSAEGLELSDVSRYLTCGGPGSFTGLRIAYAALKAFSFVTQAPLEILNGHEVRALRYLAQANSPASTHCSVQTQVAKESYLVSEYVYASPHVELVSEALVQSPSISNKTAIRLVDRPNAEGIVFPLQARALAEQFAVSRGHQSLKSWDEIAAASPAYFGSKNY